MLVVSDNINAAYRHVRQAIEDRDAGSIRELAHKVAGAGADVIDLNIGLLAEHGENVMPWLVEQVQAVTNLQLSLDARTVEALIAGAEAAAQKPILNGYYVQSAHPEQMGGRLLPFAAEKGLEVILPTIGPMGPPLDPDDRLTLAQELVGTAQQAGLDMEQIWIDPVIIHLLGGDAQAHAAAVLETMKELPLLFEPPVKTFAGVQYLSQGSPGELRSAINRALLGMLGALGLDAAMVDVLDGQTMRDVRLIKALRNESLYSVSDAELK